MEKTNQQSFITRLLIRWLICALGLWIAAGIFSGSVSYNNEIGVIIIAGLLLALVNALIKPLLVLLTLPAILLTLGLFMLIINGLIVFLVSKLYAPLEIASFWAAVGTGLVIGLVNYLVTAILEER